MRAIGAIVLAALILGAFLLYAARTKDVVLFTRGNPEVPGGRMFSIFNPFRDRTSERTADKFIADLESKNCEQIVRGLDGKEYDPRICPVMSEKRRYSLIWREDTDSTKTLVYSIPKGDTRLWVYFRRDEAGFVISLVSMIR